MGSGFGLEVWVRRCGNRSVHKRAGWMRLRGHESSPRRRSERTGHAAAHTLACDYTPVSAVHDLRGSRLLLERVHDEELEDHLRRRCAKEVEFLSAARAAAAETRKLTSAMKIKSMIRLVMNHG